MDVENRSSDWDQRGQDAASAGSAQRADGRGGEAAHRLDKRTYLDLEQGRWSIILRDYGDGLCEVGWSFVGSISVAKSGRGESESRSLHAERAGRRARSRLRHLILASGADHLLTLTYRSNVTEYRQASLDLSRFIRLVRETLPGWVYIAVPERQERGAWHWHLAVVARQDVALLRTCWRHVVGEGNIDVQPPKRGQNRRLTLVKYLGKYLAKGFEDESKELNGHRFRASHGIQVPGVSIRLPESERGQVVKYVLDRLRAVAGTVGFAWIDPQNMAGWACSWK
jgi:hypothetical protein